MDEKIKILSITLFDSKQIYGLKEFLGDREQMGSVWDQFESRGFDVFPQDEILLSNHGSFYSIILLQDGLNTVVFGNEKFQAVSVPFDNE